MARSDRTSRALGVLLATLLAWHTLEKVQTGLLPEMFWACHLATAIAAVGCLVDRPALSTFGGLFHLVVGLPAWLLELAVHGTTPSSAALHLVTPAVGVWAARREGVPSWIAPAGAALWLGAQLVGRTLDPALNVNLAWHPYDVLPAGFPAWGSHLVNLALVTLALQALTLGAKKLGAAVVR
ncbi:MAG: hypothetical protein Q8P41_28465 [Pseudomonadota bacterium]|nr:hypothetical protein [Pseudomonadota bacterium]